MNKQDADMMYKVAMRVYGEHYRKFDISDVALTEEAFEIGEATRQVYNVKMVLAQHGLPLDIWLVPSEV